MSMKEIPAEAYTYYINADLSKYIGHWIAIVDDKIVAHGKNVKEVYNDAKKAYPNKKPLLAKVPKEKTLIF